MSGDPSTRLIKYTARIAIPLYDMVHTQEKPVVKQAIRRIKIKIKNESMIREPCTKKVNAINVQVQEENRTIPNTPIKLCQTPRGEISVFCCHSSSCVHVLYSTVNKNTLK